MDWTNYASAKPELQADHIFPWAEGGPLPVAVRLDHGLFTLIPADTAAGRGPLLVLDAGDGARAETWRFLLQLAPAHYTDCAAYAQSRPWVPMEELMLLLGFRADYRNLSDWREVAAFSKDVLAFGKEYDFPPSVLRLWNRFSADHRGRWAELFHERNIRKNFIREIVADFYDLTPELREEATLRAQEQSAAWKARNRPFPGDRLRDLVRQLRYPHFEQSRLQLEEARRSFRAPHGVRLEVPAHLEDSALSLHISFASIEELDGILAELSGERIRPPLEQMLRLLAK